MVRRLLHLVLAVLSLGILFSPLRAVAEEPTFPLEGTFKLDNRSHLESITFEKNRIIFTLSDGPVKQSQKLLDTLFSLSSNNPANGLVDPTISEEKLDKLREELGLKDQAKLIKEAINKLPDDASLYDVVTTAHQTVPNIQRIYSDFAADTYHQANGLQSFIVNKPTYTLNSEGNWTISIFKKSIMVLKVAEDKQSFEDILDGNTYSHTNN